MVHKIRSFFVAAIALATSFISSSALAVDAPTAVAVFDDFIGADGEAGITVNGCTLKANGNTVTPDKITISQDNGVLIDWSTSTFSDKNATLIIRYSNLKGRSGAYGCLGTFFHSNSDTSNYDYAGVSLDKANASASAKNKAYGVNGSNLWSGDAQLQAQVPVEESAEVRTLVLVYNPSSRGTECYISTDGTTYTPYYKSSKLKTTTASYTLRGAAIGGVRNTTLGDVYGMTGLNIEKVAVFSTALTTDEMAAYDFPIYPATMMYSNPLAGGSDKVPAGAYGDITVPVAGLNATAFTAQTKVIGGTGSYSRIQTNDTQTHTVSGWFKFNNQDCTIYGARTGSGNDRGYRLYCDSNGQLWVGKINFNNNAYAWNGTPVQVTSTALTANTWYYITVAVTKLSGERNANAAVFVNGVQTYSGSDKFPTNLNGDSCTDFEIGAGVSVAGLYVDTTAVADATKIKRWATNESLVEVLPVVVKTQVYEGAALTTATRLFPNLTLAELKKCTFGAKFNNTSMKGTPKAGAALVVDSATDDTKLTIQFQVDAYNHSSDKYLKFANIEFTEANGGILARQVSAGYVGDGPNEIGKIKTETNGDYQIVELVVGTPDVPMPYCFHLDHDLYNSGSGSIKRATKQGDGTAAWSADETYGKFGYGHMLLNSQDYSYVVEDANGLALAETGWTISLWVNPNNMGAWQDVFGFDLGENRFKLERQQGNSFAIYSSNSSYNITDIAYPDNNAWMHLAFAYAADGTLNVYLDGKLVKTSTIVANGNLTKLIMGTNGVYDGGTVRNSSAMIDEVAIYGGTLDLARINWLAKNAPSALPYEKVASKLPGEGYLTTTSQLVWKNMKLADIMEFHGMICGANVDTPKDIDHPACFVVNNGATATMNVQINNGGSLNDIRGVTAEFTQVGNDVYGRAISAYYMPSKNAPWGAVEFVEGGAQAKNVSTGDSVGNYGCKNVFAYCLPQVPPQDITVHGSEVKISAINELVEEGATIANVTLDANARVKFDAVAAIDYNFVCSGALTFVGFPGQQELAKYDFSGITGGYKQAAKVIGINFNAGQGRNANGDASKKLGDNADATVPGFSIYGRSLTQIVGASSATVNGLKLYDTATDTVSDLESASVVYSSKNNYTVNNSSANLIEGYLDDGNQVKISVSGIPFDAYDVIVFASSDDGTNHKFSPIRVNGVLYTSNSDGNARQASGPADTWGQNKVQAITMGTNAMRVNNLVGDLSVIGGKSANSARGGIAAVIIVERQLRVGDEYVFSNGDCTATGNQSNGITIPSLSIPEIGGISSDCKLAIEDVELSWLSGGVEPATTMTLGGVQSKNAVKNGKFFTWDMADFGTNRAVYEFADPVEIVPGNSLNISISASRYRLFTTTEPKWSYVLCSDTSYRVQYLITTVITSLPTYEAEIDGEENWGDLEWSNVPTEGVEAVLTVVSESTLTMDGTEAFDTLKLVGEDDLTIVDIKGADVAKVDVSEFTGALTFEIDATEGLTADAALLEYIKTAPTTMKFIFKGSDSNGATVDFGTNNADSINSHIVFSAGKHNFTFGGKNEQTNFSTTGTLDNPTVLVTDGANLQFTLKDLCGWNGARQDGSIIRVVAGASLDFIANSAGNSMFMRGRLVLEPGSITTYKTGGDNNGFCVYGGAPAAADAIKAQIYVPAPATDAENTVATFIKADGSQKNLTFGKASGTGGAAITVETGATLKIDSPIDGNQSFVKYGAGNLEITGNVAPALTVNAGSLALGGTVNSLTLNTATEIEVADGKTATISALAGTGAITKTGAGTLNLPSGYTSTVTLEGGLLNSDFAGTLVIMGTLDTASFTSFPIAASVAASGNNGIIKLASNFVDGQLIKFSGTAPESIKAAGLTILDANGNDITDDLDIDEDGYITRTADTITATLNGGIYYWSEMPWNDGRKWEDGLKAILTIDYETVYLVVDSPVSASIVLVGTGNVVFTCADFLACDTIDATELEGKITFSSSNVTTIHAGDNDVDYTYSGNAQSVVLNIETTGAIKVESIGSAINIDAGEASQLTYDYKGNAEISPTIAASSIVFDNTSSTAHGVVALNAASKIADTISIEKNATIKVANAAAISGTTISGSGTIILPTSGTTVPTAPTGVTDSENWTGTVWIQVANGANAGWSIANFGNSKSTIRLSGAFGFLQTASQGYDTVLDINLELDNNGGTYAWKGDSGWSNHYLGLSSLSGNGDFDRNATGVSYAYYFANGNDFHGSINVAGGGYSFIFGNETPAKDTNNEIVVGDGAAMTLGEGKTWTARGGIKIKATASIGGAGTLASATTFESGATIDAAAGTLKLNVAPTFGETLNVTLPENETAAGYKILALTNAAEKYLNVDVTVKDDDAKDYILEQRADGIYLVENGANGVVINVPEDEEITKTLITGLDYEKTGAGTLLVKGTIEGTLTISAGEALIMPGASVGTIVTTGTGKDLYGYTVNINNCGKFAIPSGKTADQIRIFDAVGNPLDITDSDERYVYFDWEITDDACWWDYEFNGNVNNTGTEGTALKWDNDRPGGADFTDDGKLYAVKRPWRDVSTWPSVATFVMYGTMPSNDNRYYVVFGSSGYSTYNTIFLATDNVADDKVVLCKAYGQSAENVKKLCTMTVPNAQTAEHLYAFVLKKDAEQTIIDIYLDGELLQSYPFGEVINLGPGFQISSPHGGPVAGYSRPENTDQATLDWLRVYDLELTKEALEKYAEEYPYVSPNGSYQRTVMADANWSATDAWTKEGTEPAEKADEPAAGATAKLAIDNEDATTTIAINLADDVTYEAIQINGDDVKFVLAAGEDFGGIVKSTGRVTANANITFAYDAFSMENAPLTVKQGKTVTFDLSMVDMTQFFSKQTYDLTGYLTLEEDANVAFIVPSELHGRTASAAIDPHTKHYVLTITVPDIPFTYADGVWTWGTQSVTAEIVAANPGTAIAVASGTLEWPMDRASFTVNGGSLKATAAPTVACAIAIEEGGVFDVNGKGSTQYAITLNGGEIANTGNATFVTGLTVTDVSSVNLTGNLSIQSSATGWDPTTIALGENTLTKTGDGQFTLVMTTITGAGTLDIKSGKVYSSEATTFTDGTIKIASGATYQQRGGTGRSTTVAKIVGVDGAILQNNSSEGAGTMSAFTLEGALELAGGSGTFGTITLDEAALDLDTVRGLTIAGEGSIQATITADEMAGGSVVVFTKAEGATISEVTLVDEAGEPLTPSSADFDEDGNYVVAFSVAITAQPIANTYAASVTWGDGTQTTTFVNNVAMIPAGATNVKVQFNVLNPEYTFSTGSQVYEVELGTVTSATTATIPAGVTVGPIVAMVGDYPNTKFYPSLALAIAAVEDGETISMFASDENETTITKSVTIEVGTYGSTPNSINVNATAGTGVTINFKKGGVVTGTIAVNGGTVNFQTAGDNVGGNFTGTLTYSSGTVTRNADYAVTAPEGYLWYGTNHLTLISSEFTWIGASGDNWNDPTKWQGAVVPVAGAKAIINLGDNAGDYTINLPEATAALASLTLSGSATSFAFTGEGSLSATSYDISGLTATTLDLSKTTFNAAYTIPANSTLVVNGAVWTSEATFAATTSKFRYDGAYTAINGTFAGAKGTVELGGTLTAEGNITFGSTTVQYAFDGNITVSGTLTVGSGNGSIAYFNRGTIDANKLVFGCSVTATNSSEDYYLGDGTSVNSSMVITVNEIGITQANGTGLHVHFRQGCTVNLGSGGIPTNTANNPFYRNWFFEGGKIVITETCLMCLREFKEVKTDTETEINVEAEKTLTLNIVPFEYGISGSGSVRKTGAGSIVFASDPAVNFTVAAGSVTVDASRESRITVVEGGTLKLKVTDAQWITGYTSTATIPENTNIVFIAPDGNVIPGTSGKVLPPKPADRTWKGGASGEWNVAANWTPEGVPADGESVEVDSTAAVIAITVPNDGVTIGGITFKGDNAITLTGGAINAGTVAKAGAGRAEFVGGTIGAIQLVGGTLAISGDYTLPAEIATESGATFELDVAEGTSKTITSVISGAGAFKKTGEGTLTMNGLSSYTGGTTVEAGGIVFGATSQNSVGPIGAYANSTSDWDYNKAVVKDGAFIDVNGKADMCYSFELEEGAVLKNGGDTIGTGSRQTRRVALLGNATVDAVSNAFGIHNGNHNSTQLALGEYTLTKIGNGAFELVNTSISGAGTIDVQAGTLWFNTKGSVMNDGTIKLGANGALQVDANATVKNLIANNTAITGNGKLTVNNTFQGGATVENLAFGNDATVKLAQGESITANAALTLGTITLDITGYTTLGDYTVITAPNGFDWESNISKVTLEANDGWTMYADGNLLKVKLLKVDADITTSEGYNYEGISVDVDVSHIEEDTEAFIKVVVKDTYGEQVGDPQKVKIDGAGKYQVPFENLTKGAEYSYEVTIVDSNDQSIDGAASDDGKVTLGDVQQGDALFSADATDGTSDVDGGEWAEEYTPTIPDGEKYYQIVDATPSIFNVDSSVAAKDRVVLDFAITFEEGFTTEIDPVEDGAQAGVTISNEDDDEAKYWYVCDGGKFTKTTAEATPGSYTVTMEFDYTNEKVRYFVDGDPLTDGEKVWFDNGADSATKIASVSFKGESQLAKFAANEVVIDTNLAEVDGTKYATMAAALDAAGAGTNKEITLLTNIDLNAEGITDGRYNIAKGDNKFRWTDGTTDKGRIIVYDTENNQFVIKQATPQNGIDSFTSYVLQLDPTKSTDKPIGVAPADNLDPDTLTVEIKNLDGEKPLEPRDGYAVKYIAVPTAGEGTKTVISSEPAINLPLPTSGEVQYSIKIEVIEQ